MQVDLIVCSPPYADSNQSYSETDGCRKRLAESGEPKNGCGLMRSKHSMTAGYGQTPGQLGGMKEGTYPEGGMSNATIDQWAGCYSANWVGVIQEDSFCHPAKYSRALIQRIYAHLAETGAIWPGAIVLDPFGGVGLGALDAMFAGCQWVGVELERRFHQLGLENICLWNERYKGWPGWGRATLLNGDSRRLREVVQGADCVVSSPPYVPAHHQGVACSGAESGGIEAQRLRGEGARAGRIATEYGQAPGQLGAMKEGDFAAVVASPPYAETNVTGERNFTGGGGNETPASALRKGQVAAVVSSPPFTGESQGVPSGTNGGKIKRGEQQESGLGVANSGYGTSAGQLGAMKDAGFDAVVSSPPYEGTETGRPTGKGEHLVERKREALREAGYSDEYINGLFTPGRLKHSNMGTKEHYGVASGQLGIEQGDTFWEAARQIVTECYHLLRPGGAAVWVTKRFIRKGKIVDFSQQWAQLCQSVGFRLIHQHRAMLTTDSGEQNLLFGDEPEKLTKAKKSFFRRLAERRGSPAIDWEDVLCMTK